MTPATPSQGLLYGPYVCTEIEADSSFHSKVITEVNPITCATFGDDRLRGFGVAMGRISRFPIDLHCRPYITLALPCECVIYQSMIDTTKHVLHMTYVSNLIAVGHNLRLLLASYKGPTNLSCHVTKVTPIQGLFYGLYVGVVRPLCLLQIEADSSIHSKVIRRMPTVRRLFT